MSAAKDKRYLLLLLFVSAVLFYDGISNLVLNFHGDSALYINQLSTLKSGYLHFNINALIHNAGNPEIPIMPHQLVTEGGYAFTLYLFSKVHGLLPFYLNSLVLAFFVYILIRCFEISHARVNRYLLFGGIIMALSLSPNLISNIRSYSYPLRDPLSHLLGLLSLYLLLRQDDKGATAKPVLAAGICIGLASWCRLTGILFLVPAGLLLSFPQGFKQLKRKFLLLLIFAVGLLIGLAPLATQNVLEQRDLLEAGQSNSLVNLQQELKPDKAAQGLHHHNFQLFFIPSCQHVIQQFPEGLRPFLLLGLLCACFTRNCKSWALLSIALLFLVFYSCYTRLVNRYLIIVSIFLLAFTGLGLASLTQLLLHPLKHRTKQILASSVAILSLSFFTFIWAQKLQHPRHIQQNIKQFEAMGDWAREYLEGGLVFVNQQDYSTIMRFHEPSIRFGGFSILNPLSSPQTPLLDDILDTQGPAYLTTILENGEAQTSLWRSKILNHFDLEDVGIPAFSVGDSQELQVEKIVRRHKTEIHIAGPSDSSKQTLFLYAHRLFEAEESQEITLHLSGKDMEETQILRPGPNLFFLKNPVLSDIRITAEKPLPAFKKITWLNDIEFAKIDLSNAYDVPSSLYSFIDKRATWRGYPKWHRDWGSNGYDRHRSYPYWEIRSGDLLRTPNSNTPFQMRLYATLAVAKGHSLEDVDAILHSLRRTSPSSKELQCLSKIGKIYAHPSSPILLQDVLISFDINKATNKTNNHYPIRFEAKQDSTTFYIYQIEYSPIHTTSIKAAQIPTQLTRISPKSTWFKHRGPRTWINPLVQRLDAGANEVFLPANEQIQFLQFSLNHSSKKSSGQIQVRQNAEIRDLISLNEMTTQPRLFPLCGSLTNQYLRIMVPEHLKDASIQHAQLYSPTSENWPSANAQALNNSAFRYSGFHKADRVDKDYYSWAEPSCQIEIYIPSCVKEIQLQFKAKGAPVSHVTLPFSLRVNGKNALQGVLAPQNTSAFTLLLKEDDLKSGWNNLLFNFSQPWVPDEHGFNGDTRKLGFYFHSLTWTPLNLP